MIAALQRILQKHHKWLFSILLVIVTISFVFTVGSSPGIGRSSRGKAKKIFNCDLSSQKEMEQIIQEVELNAQLRQIFIGFPQVQEYVMFSRLASLMLANRLSIPEPNKDCLNRFIERYPIFLNQNQQFDSSKYNNFLEQLRPDTQRLGVFERTVLNDFRIAETEKLLSGPGFSLDHEVELIAARALTRYSFLTAKFEASSLINNIDWNQEELKQYFEEHQDSYKIGEQIVLDYVEFPRESFTGHIPEPTESELQHFYRKHKGQFKHLEEGSGALKTALIKAHEDHQVVQLATKAADQLVYDLYENNIPYDSDKFYQLLGNQALQVKALAPITLGQFSNHEHFSAEALAQASQLNGDRYYSDPIRAHNGNVCVLFFKDMIPSIIPPLDTIEEKVTQDFLAWKKVEQFTDQIENIQKIFGETPDMTRDVFAKMTADHGGAVVTHEKVPLNHRDITSREQESLLSLKPKNVSPVIFAEPSKANIIFLEQKEIPTEIASDMLDQNTVSLEHENQKIFRDHIIEMILDELGIKEHRANFAQQFQMASLLIDMQLNRNGSIF